MPVDAVARRGGVVARLGRALHVPGRVARRGGALAHHAQGADLSRRPAASSRPRRRRCPSSIGGVRNWDYRYCWLRDATFTLYALLARAAIATRRGRGATGCCARSPAIRRSCRSCTASPASAALPELTLAWLPGYAGSRPVRIGNAAVNQLQLDVYGEVIDALYQARRAGLADDRVRVARRDEAARVSRERTGASPTRASGRCADRGSTSRTRR